MIDRERLMGIVTGRRVDSTPPPAEQAPDRLANSPVVAAELAALRAEIKADAARKRAELAALREQLFGPARGRQK